MSEKQPAKIKGAQIKIASKFRSLGLKTEVANLLEKVSLRHSTQAEGLSHLCRKGTDTCLDVELLTLMK
jgi:hypothetical protein